MRKPISSGRCNACGKILNKGAMTSHLKSCLDSKAAASGSPGKGATTFHLQAEGRYAPEYWLHLEVPAAATLEKLDRFLRHIWLECCGHLSAFTIGETSYSSSPCPDGLVGDARDASMKKKLQDVLSPGVTFAHEYDFGTTTVLKLAVLAERRRPGKSTEIEILARNDPPPIKCDSCGAAATQVCSQCLGDSQAWFCDQCAPKHKCGEEMMLPAANSPRVGMCGYCG